MHQQGSKRLKKLSLKNCFLKGKFVSLQKSVNEIEL
jgi:hypothetical protein